VDRADIRKNVRAGDPRRGEVHGAGRGGRVAAALVRNGAFHPWNRPPGGDFGEDRVLRIAGAASADPGTPEGRRRDRTDGRLGYVAVTFHPDRRRVGARHNEARSCAGHRAERAGRRAGASHRQNGPPAASAGAVPFRQVRGSGHRTKDVHDTHASRDGSHRGENRKSGVRLLVVHGRILLVASAGAVPFLPVHGSDHRRKDVRDTRVSRGGNYRGNRRKIGVHPLAVHGGNPPGAWAGAAPSPQVRGSGHRRKDVRDTRASRGGNHRGDRGKSAVHRLVVHGRNPPVAWAGAVPFPEARGPGHPAKDVRVRRAAGRSKSGDALRGTDLAHAETHRAVPRRVCPTEPGMESAHVPRAGYSGIRGPARRPARKLHPPQGRWRRGECGVMDSCGLMF